MYLLIGIGILLVAGILIKISHIFVPLALAITLFVTAKAIKCCQCGNCMPWLKGTGFEDQNHKDKEQSNNNRMRE